MVVEHVIARLLLEVVLILKAHVANVELVGSLSVRARNLDRLEAVELELKESLRQRS